MTSLRPLSQIACRNQHSQTRPVPARVSIPVGSGELIKARRSVDCIRTRVPGLVITPAQNQHGQFSFVDGCNITHAPSGWRLAGTFRECSTARTFAHLLGELLAWNSRELANPLALVAAVKGAARNAPELLLWIGSLNEWKDDSGEWQKVPKSPAAKRSVAQILRDLEEVV